MRYDWPMTFCEVTYRYQKKLESPELLALEKLKGQLYGLRGYHFEEDQNLIRVSYDASRITKQDVEKALRGAGVAVAEEIVPA